MKIAVLIVSLVAVFAGCTASHRQGATAPVFSEVSAPGQFHENNVTNDSGESVIHVGNVMSISFTNLRRPVPRFTQQVGEDGTITLIYNRVFQAAGKKIEDLEKEIRDYYVTAYFTNLAVMVHISAETPIVYVDGEFRNPGRYPWTNGMTLKDAIDAAGGFTEFANHRIKIIHQDGTTQRYRLRGDWDWTNNPVLKQLDRIHNPRELL